MWSPCFCIQDYNRNKGFTYQFKYYFECRCRGGLSQPFFLSKLSISVHSGSIGISILFLSPREAEGGGVVRASLNGLQFNKRIARISLSLCLKETTFNRQLGTEEPFSYNFLTHIFAIYIHIWWMLLTIKMATNSW